MKPKKKPKQWKTARDMREIFPDVLWTLAKIREEMKRLPPIDGASNPELAEAVCALEMDIQDVPWLGGDEAVDAGVRIGMRWMSILMRTEAIKPTGKPEHPVWKHVRKLYAKNPKMKRIDIAVEAVELWDAERGKETKRYERIQSMITRHFSVMVNPRKAISGTSI